MFKNKIISLLNNFYDVSALKIITNLCNHPNLNSVRKHV